MVELPATSREEIPISFSCLLITFYYRFIFRRFLPMHSHTFLLQFFQKTKHFLNVFDLLIALFQTSSLTFTSRILQTPYCHTQTGNTRISSVPSSIWVALSRSSTQGSDLNNINYKLSKILPLINILNNFIPTGFKDATPE